MSRTSRKGKRQDPHLRCGQPGCKHERLHHQAGKCAIAGCDCDFWLEWVPPHLRATVPPAPQAQLFDQEAF